MLTVQFYMHFAVQNDCKGDTGLKHPLKQDENKACSIYMLSVNPFIFAHEIYNLVVFKL